MKEKVKTALINLLTKELDDLERIARSTKEQAIDSEMGQEDKWDTRRIEASYLAGAQAKRVEEIKRDLNLIKSLEIQESSETVSLSSIISVEHEDKKDKYFMSPTYSSHTLEIEGNQIQALSIHSPLGKGLIGSDENESIEIETPKGIKEYEILKVD
ncbi:MAG: GreA/GreB family elongation factor [Bacteriovoracaceae bacterium]|nr:GreA/GreB family elongation factor [Bacteriovoracaceae bacterium]